MPVDWERRQDIEDKTHNLLVYRLRIVEIVQSVVEVWKEKGHDGTEYEAMHDRQIGQDAGAEATASFFKLFSQQGLLTVLAAEPDAGCEEICQIVDDQLADSDEASPSFLRFVTAFGGALKPMLLQVLKRLATVVQMHSTPTYIALDQLKVEKNGTVVRIIPRGDVFMVKSRTRNHEGFYQLRVIGGFVVLDSRSKFSAVTKAECCGSAVLELIETYTNEGGRFEKMNALLTAAAKVLQSNAQSSPAEAPKPMPTPVLKRVLQVGCMEREGALLAALTCGLVGGGGVKDDDVTAERPRRRDSTAAPAVDATEGPGTEWTEWTECALSYIGKVPVQDIIQGNTVDTVDAAPTELEIGDISEFEFGLLMGAVQLRCAEERLGEQKPSLLLDLRRLGISRGLATYQSSGDLMPPLLPMQDGNDGGDETKPEAQTETELGAETAGLGRLARLCSAVKASKRLTLRLRQELLSCTFLIDRAKRYNRQSQLRLRNQDLGPQELQHQRAERLCFADLAVLTSLVLPVALLEIQSGQLPRLTVLDLSSPAGHASALCAGKGSCGQAALMALAEALTLLPFLRRLVL
jgi:hypothetical protein